MHKGGCAGAPFVTLLPVGWYRVEYQTCSGEGDDAIWQRHLVMVFDNEKGRYDAFIDALGEEGLEAYAAESLSLDDVRKRLDGLRERYFASSDDHPGTELLIDLFRIARHMGQSEGERPVFFKFVMEETWRQHLQRSINFYYQCAATETVEFLSNPSICEIRLRPGIDVDWIDPHLANMAVYLAEERAKSGLSPLGSLRATVLT